MSTEGHNVFQHLLINQCQLVIQQQGSFSHSIWLTKPLGGIGHVIISCTDGWAMWVQGLIRRLLLQLGGLCQELPLKWRQVHMMAWG